MTVMVLSVSGNGPLAGNPAAVAEAFPNVVLLVPTPLPIAPTDNMGTASTPNVACPDAATPIVKAALACLLALLLSLIHI